VLLFILIKRLWTFSESELLRFFDFSVAIFGCLRREQVLKSIKNRTCKKKEVVKEVYFTLKVMHTHNPQVGAEFLD
jgi:hypothetical protein